jgi:nucleoside-diphosphate-sugar epimerase
MKIIVTGATDFTGRALGEKLGADGQEVRPSAPSEPARR